MQVPCDWSVRGMQTWVPGCVRVPTLKMYPAISSKTRPVDLLLMHYTAGRDAPMLPRVRSWAEDGKRVSSTHIVVSRNPKLQPTVQLAPLEARTWHAGPKAVWRGSKGVNARSIGVDGDNLGYLHTNGGRFYDAYDRPYKGPKPFIDAHGVAWEPYTEECVIELCRVVKFIAEVYPVLRTDSDRVCGHEDVVSTKRDPGPAFPWEFVRKALSE